MTFTRRAAWRFRTVLLNAGALSLFLTSFCSAVRAAETSGQAHNQVRVETKTETSLFIVTFKTPQGQIHVFLPADMRPGDSIIGSTRLDPKGRQESDKETNRTQLGAYSLSLASQSHPAQEPAQHWNLPADLKAEAAVLVLTDASQQEAARVELPLSGADSSNSTPNVRSGAGKTGLPTKGQAGRPLTINQTFPAGPDDLHVLIGDKEARLLVASPRTVVVESPGDVLGKTKLQVKRGGETVAEGSFRNYRVSGGNPWPFVIVAVIITGVIVAISIQNAVNHIASGLGGGGAGTLGGF
jgi:hypothetical protein